jgi:hypothetical protein
MKPRSLPFEEGEREKSECVMKGRENSMPEKKRMKVKWVMLRMRWEFVRWVGCFGLDFVDV